MQNELFHQQGSFFPFLNARKSIFVVLASEFFDYAVNAHMYIAVLAMQVF